MMKHYLAAGSFFLLSHLSGLSQDLALQSPFGSFTSPATGCALTSTETVTVELVAFGSDLPAGTTFDVQYTIDGGAPVIESVTLVSTLLANSTYTHTFATPADLSVAATYDFDATVTLTSVADINASNNTYSNYLVTNNAASNGGAATGGTNVCTGSNSGNVTLVGYTGTILNWEYSTDGGITWINLSNTTSSQSYSNLTSARRYRAVVQNATCPAATSTEAIFTIDATSNGGTISGPNNGCISGNSGTLTLSGKTGNVLRWEFSTDGGSTFTPIANTTTTQTYLNLATTTIYRAIVQNGACASDPSGNKTITINPLSVGGSISSSDTVCASGNAGTLTLSGKTGAVARWEMSTTGGASWTNITNTTVTQNYSSLSQTTMYRARVQSSPCPVAYSDTVTITVDPATVAGTISSDATVCSGTNAGTLTLGGNNGSISGWESSNDNGLTWTSIANLTNTENYTNLTSTTIYRAIVQSGVCAPDYSDTATITADSVSLGGTLSSPATVCSGSNGGTLTLASERGNILNWEFSTDGGATWNNIANTSNSNSYTNLTQTTLYRVQVQNGICSSNYSDTLAITVDSATVAGLVSTSATVCSGSNSDTLNLGSQIGSVVEWQSSNDGGFTWLSISNTTTSQAYLNLSTTTLFRALVQSGVCGTSTSTPATITVDPVAVGGNILGGTTVCASGNSGNLTLVGYSANIVDWEQSTDGGATFSSLSNTANTESFLNLAQTTIYRAIVSSGSCGNDTSSTVTITVDQPTAGGTVTIDDTVCAGQNGDTLDLIGQTGSVVQWEQSTDNGSTWLTLSNTSTQQIYNNLLTTTLFRVRVQNGVCPAANAVAATITVNPQSDGGVVNSNTSGCEGFNSGVFTLTGNVGTIIDWETSTDGGVTWSTVAGVTTNTYNYSNFSDTTYVRVNVQSGTCSADSSSIAIFTMYPKPVASFVSDTTCLNADLAFVNTSTIPNGFIVLNTWDFGDGSSAVLGSPTHMYSDTGNFTVTLVAMSNFNCLDTITSTARVNPLPDATITSSNGTAFCENDSTILQAVVDPAYQYDWSTGDSTSTTVIDTSLNVTLMVTDTVTGCVNTNSMNITLNPAPVANAGIDTTLNIGETIALDGSGGGTYLWSPGSSLDDSTISAPTASPILTTQYVLTVTDANGCTDSDTVDVTVTETISLTITNLITPNADGFNDVWYIENIDLLPDNEVEIFNRAGQVVFKTSAYDNTWGGTYNGTVLPDGTYYYVVTFTDTDQVFKGSVNILRNN